jgi:mono/diheme cytochrome c family protein
MLAAGCFQGRPSQKPPIHLNPNMDSQEKFKAQESSSFYPDGAAMRPLPVGTVARGWLRQDQQTEQPLRTAPDQPLTGDAVYTFYTGRPANAPADVFAAKSPVPLTPALLARGQERFNIYCAVCHGQAGDGQGIATQRGVGRSMINPPPYTTDRVMNMPDGQIFSIITNGTGAVMPSYAYQIPVEDRWAIISYLRALQRSQAAKAADLEPGEAARLKPTGN